MNFKKTKKEKTEKEKCDHIWVYYGKIYGNSLKGEDNTISNIYQCSICKEKEERPVNYSSY